MYSSTPSTGKSSARKPKCELPVEPNMSKQKMHSAAKAMTVEIFYFATHFKNSFYNIFELVFMLVRDLTFSF